MINITIDCATGAEAREQLIALLYAEHAITDEKSFAIRNEKIAENFETQQTETQQTEKPVEENATKKRRTKAEIEAGKTVATAQQEKPADEQEDNDIAQTQAQDNKAANAVTKEMLQEKAVNLIRNHKKPEVVAALKKFGADSIAQADKNPLKVEDYPAVMDELNKL